MEYSLQECIDMIRELDFKNDIKNMHQKVIRI